MVWIPEDVVFSADVGSGLLAQLAASSPRTVNALSFASAKVLSFDRPFVMRANSILDDKMPAISGNQGRRSPRLRITPSSHWHRWHVSTWTTTQSSSAGSSFSSNSRRSSSSLGHDVMGQSLMPSRSRVGDRPEFRSRISYRVYPSPRHDLTLILAFF